MACSQQELSAHATAADLGRGDRVRRRQSGSCAYAGKRGPAGAQRGWVRHWFSEEAETWPEEFSVVTAEYSKQSLVGLLYRRLICTTARYHSSIVGILSFSLSLSSLLLPSFLNPVGQRLGKLIFPSHVSLRIPLWSLVELLDCHGHISVNR